MEGGESLLDTLFDGESVEDAQDVDMLDVEEGELVEPISKAEVGESLDVGGNQVNQESIKNNPMHKTNKKKKKNKRKRGSGTGPNATDISRFVVDACKRLGERKHYLMWTAVGCLGVSALSDLVKEVDAIQACGGQKTSDGSRFRNGGGILWNIIKARDPNAYKEIMTKGKEFEAYLTQDVLLGTLTVRETLTYSAHLRLPTSMAEEEIKDIIEGSIMEVGLQDCADRQIGNWRLRGISGGEKKD